MKRTKGWLNLNSLNNNFLWGKKNRSYLIFFSFFVYCMSFGVGSAVISTLGMSASKSLKLVIMTESRALAPVFSRNFFWINCYYEPPFFSLLDRASMDHKQVLRHNTIAVHADGFKRQWYALPRKKSCAVLSFIIIIYLSDRHLPRYIHQLRPSFSLLLYIYIYDFLFMILITQEEAKNTPPAGVFFTLSCLGNDEPAVPAERLFSRLEKTAQKIFHHHHCCSHAALYTAGHPVEHRSPLPLL